MSSLRDHLARTPEIRPRAFGSFVAPFIGERASDLPPRYVEEAALTVLAAVFRQSGPIREQLVAERRRFERLTQHIHRLPERPRGGD
jgi:hypothetical protein